MVVRDPCVAVDVFVRRAAGVVAAGITVTGDAGAPADRGARLRIGRVVPEDLVGLEDVLEGLVVGAVRLVRHEDDREDRLLAEEAEVLLAGRVGAAEGLPHALEVRLEAATGDALRAEALERVDRGDALGEVGLALDVLQPRTGGRGVVLLRRRRRDHELGVVEVTEVGARRRRVDRRIDAVEREVAEGDAAEAGAELELAVERRRARLAALGIAGVGGRDRQAVVRLDVIGLEDVDESLEVLGEERLLLRHGP